MKFVTSLILLFLTLFTFGCCSRETYKVTIKSVGAEQGLSIKSDVLEAAESDIVTLTANLNSNSQVSVTSSKLATNTLIIGNQGGTAKFIMPASEVELIAKFSYLEPGQTRNHTAKSVDFKMCYVPSGGPFKMGEHVQTVTQEVTLTKNYWIGETEVTQSLWQDVWGPTWPSVDMDNSAYGKGPNFPAYYINWYDAVAFCNLLTIADETIDSSEQVYYSNKELTKPYSKSDVAIERKVYVDWDKSGFRLPTEAEWEYAARYIDGTNWNNGDHLVGDTKFACYHINSKPESGSPMASKERIGEYAWWEENNSGKPGDMTFGSKKVAQKKPNALGLYDMSGNVFEYCYDWHDEYSGKSEVNPTGAEKGLGRVSRGGYWDYSAMFLRGAYRNNHIPSSRYDYFGMRLCRTAD